MNTALIPPTIHEALTQEQVITIMDQMACMAASIKEVQASHNAALLEWIQANGSFEFGGKTYIAGKKKSTRCTNDAACLEAIMEATGGDWEAFKAALKSQPVKPGAAKGLLGDDWDNHFEVTTEDKLEVKAIPTNLLKGAKT